MTIGRSQVLTTGNFRDYWHAVVRQILRRLVLETSVDHQSKLIYTRPAPWRPASMSQANQSRMKLRDCLRSFYTHMVKFLRIKVLKYLAGFSDLQLGIYDSEFQTSKGAWTLKAFAESASAIRDTYSRLNNVSDDRTVDVTEQSLSLSLKVRSLSLSLSLRASPCSSPVLLIYQYNSKL